jgi:hypothetical protein
VAKPEAVAGEAVVVVGAGRAEARNDLAQARPHVIALSTDLAVSRTPVHRGPLTYVMRDPEGNEFCLH